MRIKKFFHFYLELLLIIRIVSFLNMPQIQLIYQGMRVPGMKLKESPIHFKEKLRMSELPTR